MRTVVFIYPGALSYSGQTAASEIAIEELTKRGWRCKAVAIPPLNRNKGILPRYVKYLFSMMLAWMRMARLLFARSIVVNFNHGQSFASLLRSGIPHLIIRLLRPDFPIITSLHGSVFMGWSRSDRITKLFLAVLKASDRITILGEKQRSKLIELGINSEQLVILKNSCRVDAIDDSSILVKQSEPETFMFLHLSLLIETKGFPEFLIAAEKMAENGVDRNVEVVLCGPLSQTSFCTKFKNESEKRHWINTKISRINSHKNISAKWIEGADGDNKAELFKRTNCFVFPSRFPVEAQPLVLIEAMAGGCSLIVSDQGEIPSMVSESCAQIVNEINTDNLLKAMCRVLKDREFRIRSGLNSKEHFVSNFSIPTYGDNWEKTLNNLCSEKEIS